MKSTEYLCIRSAESSFFSKRHVKFADINVLEDSVVTCLRCGRIFVDCFTVSFNIGQYLMKT